MVSFFVFWCSPLVFSRRCLLVYCVCLAGVSCAAAGGDASWCGLWVTGGNAGCCSYCISVCRARSCVLGFFRRMCKLPFILCTFRVGIAPLFSPVVLDPRTVSPWKAEEQDASLSPLPLHCFVSCFPRSVCVQCGSRTYSTVSLRCWWRCESPDPRRERWRDARECVCPADDENLSPCWHQCEPQAMSTLSSITVFCLKAAKERETWHADRTDDDKIHLPPQSEPHRGDARYSASN